MEDLEDTPIYHAINDYVPSKEIGSYKMHLPSRGVLAGLDERFFQLMEGRGVWVLKNLLIPVLWLRLARRRRSDFVKERGVSSVSTAQIMTTLRSSMLFKSWPAQLLQELASHSVAVSFWHGEFLFHENEPTLSIAVLIKGSAAIFCTDGTTKGLKDSAATLKPLGTLAAGRLFGEYAVLAEELKTWVRAEEVCDVVFLRGAAFVSCLARLPPSIRSDVSDSSLEKRRRNMEERGMQTQDLRHSFMLKCIPQGAFADEIAGQFRPEVVPRGVALCRQGQFGTRLYYLACGTAEVSINSGDGKRVVVATLRSRSFFGELSLWYRQTMSANVDCSSVCELWALDKAVIPTIKAILQRCGVSEEIDHQTRLKRSSNLSMMKDSLQGKLCGFFANIPIFSQLLEEGERRALVKMMTPEALIANDMLFSKSKRCDRLLVITEGVLTHLSTHGDDKYSRAGAHIGFTCLVTHKWHTTAVATGNVDIWSLKQTDLGKFLTKIGKYYSALRLTRLFLQPLISDDLLPSWDPGIPTHILVGLLGLERRLRGLEIASTVLHPVDHTKAHILFPKFVPEALPAKDDGARQQRSLPSSFSVITTEDRTELPKCLLQRQPAEERKVARRKQERTNTPLIKDTPDNAVATVMAPHSPCRHAIKAKVLTRQEIADTTPPPRRPGVPPLTSLVQLIEEIEEDERGWGQRRMVPVVPAPPVLAGGKGPRGVYMTRGVRRAAAPFRVSLRRESPSVLLLDGVGSLLERCQLPDRAHTGLKGHRFPPRMLRDDAAMLTPCALPVEPHRQPRIGTPAPALGPADSIFKL